VCVRREQKILSQEGWESLEGQGQNSKITTQERTNQPGEQVGKLKTKGRRGLVWLWARERERGLSPLDISLASLSSLSLSLCKTVFLSLDMDLVYRHYGKPLHIHILLSTFGPAFLLLNFREREQHHESLRPRKQVSLSLLLHFSFNFFLCFP
jgi:hypothetical protein